MEQGMKAKVLQEVRGVVTIYLQASDIARSVDWYMSNLGCDVRQQNDGYACLRLPWGPQLEMMQSDQLPSIEYDRFSLYAPNAAHYHALLKENGVRVDEMNDTGDCGIIFNMYDPDGNRLEVWGGYKGYRQGEMEQWMGSQTRDF